MTGPAPARSTSSRTSTPGARSPRRSTAGSSRRPVQRAERHRQRSALLRRLPDGVPHLHRGRRPAGPRPRADPLVPRRHPDIRGRPVAGSRRDLDRGCRSRLHDHLRPRDRRRLSRRCVRLHHAYAGDDLEQHPAGRVRRRRRIAAPIRPQACGMVTEADLALGDGRNLHVYDAGADDPDRSLVVFWHHGTPNIGAPPEPLFPAAAELGIRWVSYDRPGYGGSTPTPGRDFASAATYTAAVADALGIDRFAVMGHSSGGPHALACGALLPDRVLGVVSAAGLAPYSADGLDWFGGMAASGVASLRASAAGRAAKEKHEASGVEYDPEFTPADLTALSGTWSWLGDVVGAAMKGGPGGLIDDDLANVGPWGSSPRRSPCPPSSCTAAGTVVPSSRGDRSQSRVPRPNCGASPTTGTSGSSTTARRHWLGSRTTQTRAVAAGQPAVREERIPVVEDEAGHRRSPAASCSSRCPAKPGRRSAPAERCARSRGRAEHRQVGDLGRLHFPAVGVGERPEPRGSIRLAVPSPRRQVGGYVPRHALMARRPGPRPGSTAGAVRSMMPTTCVPSKTVVRGARRDVPMQSVCARTATSSPAHACGSTGMKPCVASCIGRIARATRSELVQRGSRDAAGIRPRRR